ncbi:MAG: hypothetical protein AAB549_02145, partial [Patescibacteria group bacterium]
MDKAYEGVMQWIAQARAAGLLDAQIAEQLKSQGWQADQIQKILAPAIPAPTAQPAFVPKQTPTESVRTEIQQAFDPNAKSKGKSWPMRHLVLLVSVVGGLIILGGVAFAAIRGYIPLPFLNKSNLEDQLVKAIDVLSGTKSGEIGLAMSVKVEPQDGKAKRWPEPVVGAVSPAKARAWDMELDAYSGQLRTALALYNDNTTSYPATLDELREKKYITMRVEGENPITYTLSEDKKNYTLQYTCTQDSTKKGNVSSAEGTATTCTTGDSSTSVLETFDSSTLFRYLPSDMLLSGSVTTFVAEQDVNGKKSPRGYVSLKGTYASGGTTIAVDGEVRMQDAKYYAIVRQFPSLFFIDLTSLKDKWVLIDPAAGDSANVMFPLDSVSDSTPTGNDLGKVKTETVTFIRKALDTKAIVLTREGSENLNGRRLNKIKITMDADKLPATVTAYKEDATKRNALVKEVGETLDELVKAENLDRLRVIAGQTTLTIWIENLNGTPHKLQFETIVLPPEKVEKLKDKQVRLSIALTFEHLGEQPKVDVPSNPISWDEAQRLISGITEEQQKFDKQRSAVDDIRSALGNYKNRKGAYPDTLTALLEKPEKQKVTNTNASLQIESIGNSIEPLGLGLGEDPQNYFGAYNKRSTIPNDVFTGKPFVYATKDTGYTLTYEMVMPKASDDDSFGGSSYYAEMYVAGKNTADERVVSAETDASKDADYDGLTGAEELKYNTNSTRADTDADGTNDKIEIQSKT